MWMEFKLIFCSSSSAGLFEPDQPSEAVCAVQQLIGSVQQRAQPLRQPVVSCCCLTHTHTHLSIKSESETFSVCAVGRIVTMEFYGKNDLSLGVFLERYCFR